MRMERVELRRIAVEVVRDLDAAIPPMHSRLDLAVLHQASVTLVNLV